MPLFETPLLEAPLVDTPLQESISRTAAARTMDVRRLITAVLRWSMAHCPNVDDVLLALVSPETYKLLRDWQRRAFGDQEQLRRSLFDARAELLDGVLDPSVVSSITVRSKCLWSTFHKACVREQQVHDFMALRVILDGDEDDCVAALASIREVWPAVPGRSKNYIRCPKGNGYQALHDTVLLPCGKPMEVQIRSRDMHAIAEFGSAAHRSYKGAMVDLPRSLLTGIVSLGTSRFGRFGRVLHHGA
jgi:GTP pyrophosphokinase